LGFLGFFFIFLVFSKRKVCIIFKQNLKFKKQKKTFFEGFLRWVFWGGFFGVGFLGGFFIANPDLFGLLVGRLAC
jgi:hypothetical protein